MNKLLTGDCFSILEQLPKGIARLCYLDPPFYTQRDHKLSPRSRDKTYTFPDVWDSQTEYVGFLMDRLRAIRQALTPDGAVIFHCDTSCSHLARTALDDVFGPERFRSEIIWTYRRWSKGNQNLLPGHQTLLYYTKSEKFVFNPIMTDYSAATNVDQLLQERTRDASNKSVYKRDADGNTVTSGAKTGVPLSDVWDIPYLNPKAKERVGYPTQKPLLLLDRIISLFTNPNDLVLDPFCGSGTTLVSAKLAGRKYLGVDVSPDAIKLAQSRLDNPIRSESKVFQNGRESFNSSDDQILRVFDGLDIIPVQRNQGVDAILASGYQGRPVMLRVQREGESLETAGRLLARAGASKDAILKILISRESSPSNLPGGVIVLQNIAASIRDFLE